MNSRRHDGRSLRIIPLGGLGEIGKNMMVFEYGDDLIVVDAGLAFPTDEMLGVDLVIPDMSYLHERKAKIRGLILTHGHEDHVGALPYFLPSFKVPVFGTKLTLGLVRTKLTDHLIELPEGSSPITTESHLRLGCFTIEPFAVNHSIADAVGLAIRTPVGLVVHMGDFKLDSTPVDGRMADLARLAAYGDYGVMVLMSDSTNADRPGYTQSERVVGESLDRIFQGAKGRIFVASFASNIPRIQQVFSSALRWRRKVAVLGRNMENVVQVALDLGYLTIPEGLLVDLDMAKSLPHGELVILTTGSQGEPMSALSRLAMRDHKELEIMEGDTVIIAATPVPGNEKLVHRTVDHLFKLGAEVIYEPESGVHVSGHASQEELKLAISLTRPKYLVPVHGEYRHLVRHAGLARELGMSDDRILVGENGAVMEFTSDGGGIVGKVTAGNVLVDGLGVGDVGNIVLRDRRQLAQDGVLVVVLTVDSQTDAVLAGPDMISRGFVYVRESEELLEEARLLVRRKLVDESEKRSRDWSTLKNDVRDTLGQFFYERTKRRPMILPIIMET